MKADDEQILAAIRQHHDVYGYAPSERELARAVGMSLSGLHHRLAALEQSALIARDRGRARSIRVLPVGIR